MTDLSSHFNLLISQRLRWAEAFADGVMAASEELVTLCHQEIAKPRDEVITAEILPLVAACCW